MQRHRTPERAFTLIEVLVLIGIVTIILALVPMGGHRGNRARAQRIACLSNLKQIGLGFRLYSNDHGDRFPWQLPMSQTGTLEYALSPQVYRHFRTASNDLYSSKLLHCRSDVTRTNTGEWERLTNTNLSYFINVAAEENPQTILLGDRNIIGGTLSNGFMRIFRETSVVSWTKELHVSVGNLGLADGSAQQSSAGRSNTIGAARLAIP